jgi:hypothetical protein
MEKPENECEDALHQRIIRARTLGRDLDIADALRKNDSGIVISWLAEDPASLILKEAGERLLPEAELLAQGNEKLEDFAKEYNANS